MTGVDGLTSLKKLHLRHNKIEKLEEETPFEEMYAALEYLNLRTNKVANMDELHKIVKFPALTDLNVLNCPCELAESSMNIMICKVLGKEPNPRIKRFCKVEITDVNRLESVFYAEYEWKKAEEARKEKLRLEAEAAAKEEEGG